jgi:hypothetical protein
MMPIGGGSIVTLFSTTTTALDSIALDETLVYLVERLSTGTSSSGNARIAALPKNGGIDVTLSTTSQYGCCLQLGNRRLFWRGSDGIHPRDTSTGLLAITNFGACAADGPLASSLVCYRRARR